MKSQQSIEASLIKLESKLNNWLDMLKNLI